MVQFILKYTSRIAFHIYLNIYGLDLIKHFMKNLRPFIKNKCDKKILIICLIWLIHILIIFSIIIILFIQDKPLYMPLFYFHEFCLHSLPIIILLMSLYICNILDDINNNLNLRKFYRNYKNFTNRRSNNIFLVNKIIYLKIRKTLVYLNNNISNIIIFYIISIIYLAMFDIYYTLINDHSHRGIKPGHYKTIFQIILDLFLFCLICGSIKSKSDDISHTLDNYNSSDLSDYEYKEWLMFKIILKNSDIGFTIGKFAKFNKTTLLAVSILLIK